MFFNKLIKESLGVDSVLLVLFLKSKTLDFVLCVRVCVTDSHLFCMHYELKEKRRKISDSKFPLDFHSHTFPFLQLLTNEIMDFFITDENLQKIVHSTLIISYGMTPVCYSTRTIDTMIGLFHIFFFFVMR